MSKSRYFGISLDWVLLETNKVTKVYAFICIKISFSFAKEMSYFHLPPSPIFFSLLAVLSAVERTGLLHQINLVCLCPL